MEVVCLGSGARFGSFLDFVLIAFKSSKEAAIADFVSVRDWPLLSIDDLVGAGQH